MSDFRIISSDNHVIEPPDLWTNRIDPRFKGREPRVVRLEDGSDFWFTDGVKGDGMYAGAQSGVRFEEPENLSLNSTFEDVRPGGYIPEEHIKDMDVDGIDVGIIYPTSGLLLYAVPDGELLNSVLKTYNDWLAEFCAVVPNRLKGIAMLNIDDVEQGVQELHRCQKLGLVGAMITVYPLEDRSYALPEYEPLWAAAQDLGMPLSLHIGTNRASPGQPFVDVGDVGPAAFTNVDYWVRMSLSHMIFSGVFERYPKLQVGAVEHEVSWVPHFLDRLDYNYTQRPPSGNWYTFKEDMLPSDYFHRNVFLGFQEDELGIELRHRIGVDNLLWGSDYPHPESTFPRSREIIEEILVDCTDDEKAKIAGGNSARIYHL
jgi:predicted TIM-barrel fold metal-dependent hydrolase